MPLAQAPSQPACCFRRLQQSPKPPLGPRDFRVILLCSPMLLRAQRTPTAARPTIYDIASLKYLSELRPRSRRKANANPLTPAHNAGVEGSSPSLSTNKSLNSRCQVSSESIAD